MKVYRDYYGGDVPELEVLREGKITRINFDFSVEEKTIDEETVRMLVSENVDVNGIDYSAIVNGIVTERYPSDKYEAVMANYAEANDPESELTPAKRQEYLDEYAAFQAWRKKAKQVAADVVLEIESA